MTVGINGDTTLIAFVAKNLRIALPSTAGYKTELEYRHSAALSAVSDFDKRRYCLGYCSRSPDH